MAPEPEVAACAALADDLGTLAAGALTGPARATVLLHVERCPACAAELESLSVCADALLHLYPEAEPDPGLAERVLARISSEGQPTAGRPRPRRARRPRPRVVVAVAAALALLGLGGGLTAAFESASRPPGPAVVAAPLRSAAGPEGTVTLSTRHGDWLSVSFVAPGVNGDITCQLTLVGGGRRVLGRFDLGAGYGSWTVPLGVAPSAVRLVSLIAPSGATLASARFRGAN